MMLTAKQSRLHAFILQRQATTGVAPSYDEMAVAMGLRSKSGVHRMVAALEERGWVRRIPNRARALEALAAPGIAGPEDATLGALTLPLADHARRHDLAAYVEAGRALERMAWEHGVFVDVRVMAIHKSSVAEGELVAA